MNTLLEHFDAQNFSPGYATPIRNFEFPSTSALYNQVVVPLLPFVLLLRYPSSSVAAEQYPHLLTFSIFSVQSAIFLHHDGLPLLRLHKLFLFLPTFHRLLLLTMRAEYPGNGPSGRS